MSRLRSSMVLLGICVIALLIGVLRLATQRTPLPTGSSYSADPNGAQGLYAWIEAVGGSPGRLQVQPFPTHAAAEAEAARTRRRKARRGYR